MIGLIALNFSNLAVAYVDLFGSVSVACLDNHGTWSDPCTLAASDVMSLGKLCVFL